MKLNSKDSLLDSALWAKPHSTQIRVAETPLEPLEDRREECFGVVLVALFLTFTATSSLHAQSDVIHKLIEPKPNVAAASLSSYLERVADSTLGEVVTQVTSAIATAVSGNNGTLNASDLASVAQKLSGIRDQVLSLANTSYQGQYLFGGSQGSVPPFALDTSTNPATATYNGDSKLQYVETPNGQKIQVNLPGSSVFGAAGSGVLGALNQLISDFSSGAATGTLTADTSALTTALGQLSAQRSTLDSSLSRVQSTSTYVQTQESQLKVAQSSLVAADPAAVATQLSQTETQHQALLSVINALSGSDLFSLMR